MDENAENTSDLHPVLVGTDRAGLWFGYLEGESTDKRTVITRARQVAYWSSNDRLAAGLAANGPSAACRVSPAAPRATLYGNCTVLDVTAQAAARFEAAPWAQ